MEYRAISFAQKFGLFQEQWQPKVIAEMNDYQFKVVKLQGDFIWHDHKDTDETFIVIEGDLRIDFRNGAVHVRAGEMFVVPKGVEHKPYAEKRGQIAPDRTPRRAEYGGCGWRADSGTGRLDLTASTPSPHRLIYSTIIFERS